MSKKTTLNGDKFIIVFPIYQPSQKQTIVKSYKSKVAMQTRNRNQFEVNGSHERIRIIGAVYFFLLLLWSVGQFGSIPARGNISII